MNTQVPEMTYRDRVSAALEGAPVDFPPSAFWAHNFSVEGSPRDLAEATARLATRYDFDFVKVQTRFSCYAECWGSTWTDSEDESVPPLQEESALSRAGSLADLLKTVPSYRPLAEQVEALRLLRELIPDRPILMTVFSPLMTMQFLLRESPEQRQAALSFLREAPPGDIFGLLSMITDLHARFAEECVTAGADGIFYASDMTSQGLATPDDLDRFEAPYGHSIFESVASATMNMIHLCGSDVALPWFSRYPAHCFSWDIEQSNPTLAQGKEVTGRAVVGGISAKPNLRAMTALQVAAQVENALAETNGRHVLIAPGCSVNWDTPSETLDAIGQASSGLNP